MSGDLFNPRLLAGRVALVTGASSGLGRHFAGVLARHGATVVLAARRTDLLDSVAAELATSAPVHRIALDVRSAAAVDRALARVLALASRLDIVVNNAGITATKPALQTTEEDWTAVVDTNLSGAFRVARASAQVMADLLLSVATLMRTQASQFTPLDDSGDVREMPAPMLGRLLREQAALADAELIVWQHPIQWYSMPALMKLWVDEVLAFGWAYGPAAVIDAINRVRGVFNVNLAAQAAALAALAEPGWVEKCSPCPSIVSRPARPMLSAFSA